MEFTTTSSVVIGRKMFSRTEADYNKKISDFFNKYRGNAIN